MIRISQQQQGEMFSNTIFIIFNNQHRHCNIVHRWMQSYKNMQQSATVLAVHCSSEYNHIKIPQPPIYNTQNIYNWKQCNWQHANTTERCSIWYILYNNQPQCLSHIYKELSVKISITEWQCIQLKNRLYNTIPFSSRWLISPKLSKQSYSYGMVVPMAFHCCHVFSPHVISIHPRI